MFSSQRIPFFGDKDTTLNNEWSHVQPFIFRPRTPWVTLSLWHCARGKLLTDIFYPEHIAALAASQSLRASAALGALCTGLDPLDGALASPAHLSSRQNPRIKGIPRAQVTEICGPPGVGKTILAWVLFFSLSDEMQGTLSSSLTFPITKCQYCCKRPAWWQ